MAVNSCGYLLSSETTLQKSIAISVLSLVKENDEKHTHTYTQTLHSVHTHIELSNQIRTNVYIVKILQSTNKVLRLSMSRTSSVYQN